MSHRNYNVHNRKPATDLNLSAQCPRCGAQAGTRCRTGSGQDIIDTVHAARKSVKGPSWVRIEEGHYRLLGTPYTVRDISRDWRPGTRRKDATGPWRVFMAGGAVSVLHRTCADAKAEAFRLSEEA